MGLLSPILQGLGGLFGTPDQGYSSPSPGFDPAPPVDPFAPSRGQRFAALLKDAGTSLQGGDSDYQAQLRLQPIVLAQKRAELEAALRRQKALQDFAARNGGGAPQAGPPATGTPQMGAGAGIGPSVPQSAPRGLPSVREIAPDLLRLQAAGVDTSDLLSIYDKASPDVQIGPDGLPYDKRDASTLNRRFANRTNVNGHIVDLNNPANEGDYFGKLPDNSEPVYDRNGKIVGVKTIDGALQVLGDTAAATSRGQAMGSAPYDFQTVPTPSGAPGLAAKSAIAGQTFVGQSPAEAAVAASGAQAQIDLPKVVANADQTLGLIRNIRQSPALRSRTGLLSVAPAIPGTEGANFDAMTDQLKGKVFLEAFASLKGSGQITEVEGEKATNAIARLNRAQTPQAFDQAMAELEDVVKAGRDRAQTAAQRGPRAAGAANLPSLADIDAAIARKQGRR